MSNSAIGNIVKSLNSSLSNLIAKNTKDITRAIISTDGTGHYITIAEAISAGEKLLILKDGTHEITSDITISNHKIYGQSRRNTIINISNNAKIICDSSGDRVKHGETGVYEIKATQDSSLISKAGSTDCGFTDVTPDSTTRLLTKTFNLKVTSITDTNNLNVYNTIPGRIDDIAGTALALQPYTVGNFNSVSAEIYNLTIKYVKKNAESVSACLEIYGLGHIIKDVNFRSISDNITFIHTAPDNENEKICSNLMIDNCVFEGGYRSIQVDHLTNSNIKNNYFINNKDCIIYTLDCELFENINIESNNFLRSEDAIQIENAKNISIRSNNFFNIKTNCIYTDITPVEDIKISIIGNRFYKCASSNYAITCNANGSYIAYNIFSECDSAIKLKYISVEAEENIIILGNQFLNCGTDDIIYGEAKGILIKNNIFKNTGKIDITLGGSAIIEANQFIDQNNSTLVENIDGSFSGNQVTASTNTDYTFIGNKTKINGNFFTKTSITFSGSNSNIKANEFRNYSGANFAAIITGDLNIFSVNLIKDCANGLDIQATADKTNVCENIWNTITTTAYQNNGTNTVVTTNITV